MGLPFLAQLGIATAPSALQTVTQLFGGRGQKTAYEKEIGKLSQMFKTQYDLAQDNPLETDALKSQKKVLDEAFDQRKKNLESRSVVTGATDEARLAGQESLNRTYDRSLQRLLGQSQQVANQNLSQYINALGTGDQLRRGREGMQMQKIQSIFNPLSQATNSFLLSDALNTNRSGSTQP